MATRSSTLSRSPGNGSRKGESAIFDRVLDSAFEEEEYDEDVGFQLPRHCEHCHRMIEGKQYAIGNHFYDKGCFKYRFVLEAALLEEERRIELKKRKNLDKCQ